MQVMNKTLAKPEIYEKINSTEKVKGSKYEETSSTKPYQAVLRQSPRHQWCHT